MIGAQHSDWVGMFELIIHVNTQKENEEHEKQHERRIDRL